MLAAIRRNAVTMELENRLTAQGLLPLDPERSFVFHGWQFGPDAAQKAVDLMKGHQSNRELELRIISLEGADCFELHDTSPLPSSVFMLPNNARNSLPTAVEIALVEAFHTADDDTFDKLIKGGCVVALGQHSLIKKFCDLLARLGPDNLAKFRTLSKYKDLTLSLEESKALSKMDQSCLCGYLKASPAKFEFIELYRLMEARYLESILHTFNSNFMRTPKDAVRIAAETLESEVRQLCQLSDRAVPFFEIIFEIIKSNSDTNKFAAALYRKLQNHGGELRSPKHRGGAALVYYIRCAIVHAGGKDIVFESFEDSAELLELLMEHMEETAFALAGLEFRS